MDLHLLIIRRYPMIKNVIETGKLVKDIASADNSEEITKAVLNRGNGIL